MEKFTKDMELGVPTDHAPFCIDGFCNEDGEIFEVCSVWGVNDVNFGCEQSKANAYLFATSSKMYYMLERILNNSTIQVNLPNECEEIESLLDEARGE